LVDESRGEAGVVDEDAHFDVAGLAAVGEVGGGHEGLRFVDDDAFGVEAESGLGLRRAGVAVNRGKGFPEGPVLLEEAFDGVHEHRRLDASLGHRLVKRGEDLLPVVEGVAPDEDALPGVLEELSYDDEGVAGGADEGLGAGPDEVDAGDGTVASLGDRDPEDSLKGRAVESAESAEVVGDVLQTVGGQGGFGRRRTDPFPFYQAQEGFEVGERNLRQAAVLTHRSRSFGEERELGVVSDGRNDEGPVEVPIEALAGALGDEQAPVAGGAFESSTPGGGKMESSLRPKRA